MAAPSASTQSLKTWQVWHGAHTFCCDGRFMVGPDFGVTVFAFLLTSCASIAFWIFVCPSLPLLYTVIGVVLYVQTVAFMAATATTDPGIVPSNRNMDEAEADACAASQRSIEVNGVQVPLKWCRTCRIFRPPRAAHCSECNVCVEKFDHHCPWMGQCIGRRNYRFFLGFVISVVALCCYTLVFSAYIGYRAAIQSDMGALHSNVLARMARHAPASLALVGLPGLIVLCVAPLACYHCSLVCSNKTTSEEIKDTYPEFNPFSGTLRHNCNEACCEPREPPRLRPRGLAAEPERLDTCHLIEGGDGPEGGAASTTPAGPHEARGGLRTAPPADVPDV